MAETQWETCSADALLREFFAQDDLSRLAEGAGALLGCPLLVLDDTFHVAAHHLPLGFSDAVFQASVRSGEITYEAGAIISRSPALTAGNADYVQLEGSAYRRRFAPLISAGVRLGYLICVDTDGHLEKYKHRRGALWNRFYPSSCSLRPAGRISRLKRRRIFSGICWTAAFRPLRISGCKFRGRILQTSIRLPSRSSI